MCPARSSTWRHFVLIRTTRNAAMRIEFRDFARCGGVSGRCIHFISLQFDATV